MLIAKRTKHWFHGMSLEKQKAYIAAHPNSIYAKKRGVGQAGSARSSKQTKAEIKSELRHFENVLKLALAKRKRIKDKGASTETIDAIISRTRSTVARLKKKIG